MHYSIYGITYSGKSWLAKFLAKLAADKNEAVGVYDPTKSEGWPASARKFTNPEQFLDWALEQKETHLFIDEAKTLFDHDTKRAEKLLYMKRHDGCLCYLMAQRATMIPPNARNMCSRVASFKQNGQNPKILSEEYDEIFRSISSLPKITFIYSDGFTRQKMKLDFSGGYPPIPVPA